MLARKLNKCDAQDHAITRIGRKIQPITLVGKQASSKRMKDICDHYWKKWMMMMRTVKVLNFFDLQLLMQLYEI